MHPIYRVMAEIWQVQKHRDLTPEELTELEHCLTANMEIVRKLATLENWSYIARLEGNIEWQHEICKQIDELTSYRP